MVMMILLVSALSKCHVYIYSKFDILIKKHALKFYIVCTAYVGPHAESSVHMAISSPNLLNVSLYKRPHVDLFTLAFTLCSPFL